MPTDYEETRAANKRACQTLRMFEVDGVKHFSGSGPEAALVVMSHARCLLMLLANAFDDVDTIDGQPHSSSATRDTRSSLTANAVRGIEDLVALSMFLVEAA